MNELQIFANEQFGSVRIIEEDGKVLFCGKDIASALGYSNPRDALNRHCRGVVKRDGVSHTTNQYGVITEQVTEMSFIPEGDVYRLIVSSKLPKAQEFEVWLFEIVLPSIRKTGGYIAGEEHMDDDQLLAQAVLVAQRKLEERTVQLEAANRQIEADRPKVVFADAVSGANNSISVGDLSKILHQNGVKKLKLKSVEKTMGQNNLFEWLRDNGYLIKQGSSKNMPTQVSTERGLVEIKESIKANPDGTLWITKTPKITGKGQQYFINLFVKAKEETV